MRRLVLGVDCRRPVVSQAVLETVSRMLRQHRKPNYSVCFTHDVPINVGRPHGKSNCWDSIEQGIQLLETVYTGFPIAGVFVWPGCFYYSTQPFLIYSHHLQRYVASNDYDGFCDLVAAAARNVFYYSTRPTFINQDPRLYKLYQVRTS